VSEHFSIAELTRSELAARKGIDNPPTPEICANLEQLATQLLEPTRTLLGVPMHVNSGYRSFALNVAVGGSKTSAHMRGQACDFFPIGMSLEEAFDRIRHSEIPFDQVIIECNTWIHIGAAQPGYFPRRQALRAKGSPGKWEYELVT
jgi:zinc D-Ala-D-Ala carboxypeptidase